VKRYEDDVLPGADSAFAFDELSRLTQVQESTWNSSTITTKTCQEDWTLDQFRNWLTYKKDSDGDGAYSTAKVNDIFDDGVFDIANKYTKRVDKKPTPSVDKNMAYTPTGALTNDGKAYKDMKYDAWGRLVEVRNQSSVVQAAYRYNGVGHRITWQDDADNDADVDANDPVYHLAVTEGGSMLAIHRGSDANVKEQIYLHLRGLNGWPSVKCDGETEVIVVDADRSTAWSAAADTVTETRSYLLTNQRGDVVTVISDAGRVRERPRYSAYGVPITLTEIDFNLDGNIDPDDPSDFIGAPYDWDLDGDTDATDNSNFASDYGLVSGNSYGRAVLSLEGVRNILGYAGYVGDRFIRGSGSSTTQGGQGFKWHVRHRVLDSGLGRWTRRDPLGYVDGMGLYEYVASAGPSSTDPTGLVVNCRLGNDYTTNLNCCYEACDESLGEVNPLGIQCCYYACQEDPRDPAHAMIKCLVDNPYVRVRVPTSRRRPQAQPSIPITRPIPGYPGQRPVAPFPGRLGPPPFQDVPLIPKPPGWPGWLPWPKIPIPLLQDWPWW